jgi:hypothetical protein
VADSNPTRVRNRERTETTRRAFEATLTAYRATASLYPIQAMRLDPSIPQSRALNHTVIEFGADIQLAVSAALKNSVELPQCFDAIVNEDTINPKLSFEVEQLCGAVFAARGLQPHFYFKKVNRGSAVRRFA